MSAFVDLSRNSVEVDSAVHSLTKVVERANLVYEQKMAHDIFTRNCLNDAYSGGCVIVWGMGGCGKSETIFAVQTTLSRLGVKCLPLQQPV